LKFLDLYSKKYSKSNVTKIHPERAEFYMRTDRRTDRQDKANSRFSQFYERT